MEPAGKSALEGVKILDLTHVYQGPMGTQILADYGADVIKVERSGRGDWSRAWGPFVKDLSLPFANLNRNKRSLCLDLKSVKGKEIFLKLVSKSDVLVHNFRKGVMEKLGLGDEDLRKLNPRLIHAWSSGWGDHGPYADSGRGGHDMMARAEAGWFISQTDGKPPIPGGISIDYTAGLNLIIGILMALYHRAQTGQGQHLSTDLFSVAFHAHAWEGASELNEERIDRPARVGGTEAAISKAFTTRDGYIEISPVFSDNSLRDISMALGLDDLSQDPRFETETKQITNKLELNTILAGQFLQRTTEEWMTSLEEQGVFCARIRSFKEASANPQIHANGMIVEMNNKESGSLSVVGNPIRLHGTPPEFRYFPPRLGQHSAEICGELGLKTTDIEELLAERIVSQSD